MLVRVLQKPRLQTTGLDSVSGMEEFLNHGCRANSNWVGI